MTWTNYAHNQTAPSQWSRGPVRGPLAACACLAGSILPHCSQAVNTFAAACQAPVKYCLCSHGPISRQLKAAMKTQPLPDSQCVQCRAKHVCSVLNAVHVKIIEGRKRQSRYGNRGWGCDETTIGWNYTIRNNRDCLLYTSRFGNKNKIPIV